jgi:magnesium-transporting ATPase (P-type)
MAAPHTDAVFESVLSSRIEQPWAGSAQDVIQSLDSDPDTGLGADDVTRRRAAFGPNMLHTRPPEPGWRRFLRQFTDPLVILLIVAAAIALVAWIVERDEALPFDAIVIALIVLANAVLGHVQQARAAQAVAALRQMAAPTAQVTRDGVVMAIPASDVVPGDVLTLAEGDAIVADARLIEGASLMVSEASLTGESEPVAKDPAPVDGAAPVAERQSMVFSGTGVTRGRGRAVVTSTGMRTEMGHIATLLDRTEDVTTPLQREVGRVGRMLGVAVIVIAVVVVAAIMLTGTPDTVGEFVAVLLIGVSLAVAAVPEGLHAILSIARTRRPADGQAQRDRQEPSVGRDVGFGVHRVYGQNRDTHQERDDHSADRDRVGNGRRLGDRLRAIRRVDRGRVLGDAGCAARRSGRGAACGGPVQ